MEPVSAIAVSTIAQLAFHEFVKSGAGELAKQSLGVRSTWQNGYATRSGFSSNGLGGSIGLRISFLLDTNICIYIIKRRPPKVFEKFQTLQLSDMGVSSITIAELEYGAFKSQHQDQNRSALSQFLMPLEILPFDQSATQTYGQTRAALERQGKVILRRKFTENCLSNGSTIDSSVRFT